MSTTTPTGWEDNKAACMRWAGAWTGCTPRPSPVSRRISITEASPGAPDLAAWVGGHCPTG